MSDTSCFAACCGCCAINCSCCKNGKAALYYRADVIFSDAPDYQLPVCTPTGNCVTCGAPGGCCCNCTTGDNSHSATDGGHLGCDGACGSMGGTWLLKSSTYADYGTCQWVGTKHEGSTICAGLPPNGCPPGGTDPNPCCMQKQKNICDFAPSCSSPDYHSCYCPSSCPTSGCRSRGGFVQADTGFPRGWKTFSPLGGYCFTALNGTMTLTVICDAPYTLMWTVQATLTIGMTGDSLGNNATCGATYNFQKIYDGRDPLDPAYTGPPDCSKPLVLNMISGHVPGTPWCSNGGSPAFDKTVADYCGNPTQDAWSGCDFTGTSITFEPVFTGPLPMLMTGPFDREVEPLYIRRKNNVVINIHELERRNIVNRFKRTMINHAKHKYNQILSTDDWKKCDFHTHKVMEAERFDYVGKFLPKEKPVDVVEDDQPIEVEQHKKIGLLKKIANLGTSLYNWNREGRPLRSAEEIADIYDNICTKCPFFQNDQCGLCGCNIKREGTALNKLAFATESCPDNPSKWGPNSKPISEKVPLINVNPDNSIILDELLLKPSIGIKIL